MVTENSDTWNRRIAHETMREALAVNGYRDRDIHRITTELDNDGYSETADLHEWRQA